MSQREDYSGYSRQQLIDAITHRDSVIATQEEQMDAIGAGGVSSERLMAANNAAPTSAGWKDAATAWEVCASIHRKFAKGKDALFTTRQGDFVRHADNARSEYRKVVEGSGNG